MKRIFIGGLGRSGTTIALNALYRHGAVFAVPIETKFLVEEDGFADLVAALTRDFSIGGSIAAYNRFEHLMRRQVTGIDDSKFRQQHTLSSCVFPRYDGAVDAFVSLVQRRRYFTHPAPLLAAIRHFVAETFDAETIKAGKAIWAEKTPANIWRLPFLRDLWPTCHFIHALRDPRAILASLMRLRWLPTEMIPALTMFEGHLAALLEVRRRHAGDPGFFEMRLEDLLKDTPGTLAKLATALDMEAFDPAATDGVRSAMDAYYGTKAPVESQLSAGDHALMVETLRPAAIELGYPSSWQEAA